MLLRGLFKYILLLVLAVILTSATVIFGAIPMRVIRRCYGRMPFWLGGLIATLALLAMGVTSVSLMYFVLTLVIGVYSEVEDHGASLFTSGLVSLLTAVGVSSLTVGLQLIRQKSALIQLLKEELTPIVNSILTAVPSAQLTVDDLVRQMPSMIAIVLVVALALGLISERRMRLLFQLPDAKFFLPQLGRLMTFRMPDLSIWLTIAVVFGAFFQHGIPWVELLSINLLNVMVVLFFFQGLAVVAFMFRLFRVAPFWRVFWYVLIFSQLALLVMVLGFADYWLEVREKWSQKAAQINKGL